MKIRKEEADIERNSNFSRLLKAKRGNNFEEVRRRLGKGGGDAGSTRRRAEKRKQTVLLRYGGRRQRVAQK